MIWKIYKLSALLSLRSCFAAFTTRNFTALVDTQSANMSRIERIIQVINHYYGMHPSLLEGKYANVEAYLSKHLSEKDWYFLIQTDVIKSADEYSAGLLTA